MDPNPREVANATNNEPKHSGKPPTPANHTVPPDIGDRDFGPAPLVIEVNEDLGERFALEAVRELVYTKAGHGHEVIGQFVGKDSGDGRATVKSITDIQSRLSSNARWRTVSREISEIMGLVDVGGSLVLHKKAARCAYILKFDGMAMLGALDQWMRQAGSAELARSRKSVIPFDHPQPSDAGPRCLTDIFCWLTASVGAGCARAFAWDRLLNRPRQVWSAGLRYPHFALASSLSNPVPRRLLLDADGAGPVFALPGSDLNRDTPGAFCQREAVVASVAVLFTPAAAADASFGGERILLFLNFRAADFESPASPISRHAREVAVSARVREEYFSRFSEDIARSLQLFVQHMNGWLERKAVAIDAPVLPMEPGVVGQAATSIWQAGLEAAGDVALPPFEIVADIVARLFHPPSPRGLRSVPVAPTVCRFETLPDGVPCLHFSERLDEAGSSDPLTIPIPDLDSGAPLPERSSLSARTLQWRRSVLLALKPDSVEEKTQEWRELMALHRRRAGFDPIREAVVPILFGKDRLGTITLQEDAAGSQDAVRCVDAEALELLESCATAFGGMSQLRTLREKPAIRHFLRSVRPGKATALSQLLLAYTEAVRMAAGTHFAYVVLHDSVLGFCRPMGVSAHSGIFESIYQRYDLPAPISPSVRALLEANDAMIEHPEHAHLKLSAEDESALTLFRRALTVDLLPRRDGISWQVFARAGGQGWDVVRDEADPRWPRQPELLSSLGALSTARPFRCHPTSDPLGVLWTGLVHDVNPGARESFRLTRQRGQVLGEESVAVVEPLTNAVASLVSLLRFRGFDEEGGMRITE